jgi:hypothetical protein
VELKKMGKLHRNLGLTIMGLNVIVYLVFFGFADKEN